MKEISLNLDIYDRPKTLQGKEAWIQLILNLLYMRKGSFPSCPEMGVGLLSYEFEFSDVAIHKIQSELMEQISTYLPEIPLTQAQITAERIQGYAQPVLFLYFTFVDRETSVVIAADDYHVIDFAIAV